MKKALTIDIGGTKIYYTVIDEKGKIIAEVDKFQTPKDLEGIKEIIKGAVKKYEGSVHTIGISTAGAVNNENTGVLGSTGNLVKNYPELNFQKISRLPVFVENDANSAAWAEHEIGASKGCRTSVMLTLGTGVGGGIIIDSKLFKGKSGAAGEMHFKMYPDKRRKCTCGAYDCFEAYASGTGLKKTAEEMTGNPDVTTYDVVEGAEKGDPLMKDILSVWQGHITAGIIGLANLFDPDCVVLSGSMAQFVDTKKVEKEVNEDIVTTPTSIRIATAGNHAGMIGVALLALAGVQSEFGAA